MGIEEQIDRLIDLGEDIKSRLDRLIKIGEKFCGPVSSDQFVVPPESELPVMTFSEAIEKAKGQFVDAVVSAVEQPVQHPKEDHFVGAGKMVTEEPPKPSDPEYREPVLPVDYRMACEFSDDGECWSRGSLSGWSLKSGWISGGGVGWRHCRIKKES